MKPRPPFIYHSLNWDMPGAQNSQPAILNPRDIFQVAFLLEGDLEEPSPQEQPAAGAEKRFIIGRLNIEWRSSMGDRGNISTGWLTGKKR
jgi:hypothetical protein